MKKNKNNVIFFEVFQEEKDAISRFLPENINESLIIDGLKKM